MPNEYLEKQRKVIEEEMITAVGEANKSIRELNKQLMIFATAVISISLLIFHNLNTILDTTICDKYILSIIWALLGFSVFFGIKQFITDYNFFIEWKKFYSTLWEKVIIEQVSERIKKEFGNNIIDANKLGELVIQQIREQYKGKVNKPESSIVYISPNNMYINLIKLIIVYYDY